MNDKLTIYQKPSCITCEKTMLIVKDAGVDFNAIDDYINPISKEKLEQLL